MLIQPIESLKQRHAAIKKVIDTNYNANQSVWQIYWTEATRDVRLEAGDITLMNEFSGVQPNNNSVSYYFNRVRPLLNMVSGQQRRQRKSAVVYPLENGDQETADQWSKILLHIYKKENVYETISEGFHQGPCITGMNMLQLYIDWRDDPISGDIKVDNCAYNTFFIDPYFRKPDLSDCNFVWKRSYLTHSAAASLLPEHYDEIMALPGNPTGTGRDGRFQYMPESYGQSAQNKVAYDEYYYRDYREQKKLIDKRTGASIEITELEQTMDIDFFMENYGNDVKIITQTVPTVRLAIMVQDQVFYDGPNPFGIDHYPFIPLLGFYNPMMPYFYSRIQGLARSLRDPQILLNRRIVLSADLLESQVNSGWIFKENAPVDVSHLFQTGQGRVIPLKEEAQMTDLQPIQPPQIPNSFFQLQDTFSKETMLVTGISEELMGMASDAKAGITEVLRQNAGLVTLQPLFDRLDNAQILLSERMMEMVRANYTPSKIQRMLEGQEPQPLFFNKAFGKYHCAVELGFNTDTQKQMQLAQLVQLKEIGVQIPDQDILEAAPIQNKTEITQRMMQQQQAQMQMQQQQAQVQMQEQQARTELAQARAVADQGLGLERVSRVQENEALAVERKAEAQKDNYQALLNYAKAIKEMESVEIDDIYKLLQMKQMLATERNETTEGSGVQALTQKGVS